jgi:formylglycine-generating enzyme
MTSRGVAGVRAPKTAVVPARDGGGAGFRLGRTPVTNGEYAPYLAEGEAEEPPWWRDPAFAAPEQPVVGVTWSEAAGFAAWLGRAAGGTWRLPAAAEWEWAARGGLAAAATAWGERVPDGEIPVGPLRGPWLTGRGTPNGYGLLDIGTIVHEWCTDVLPDPRAPEGERRVSCGGSWRHQVRWSPPAARSSLPPSYRYADYGFRVLRDALP